MNSKKVISHLIFTFWAVLIGGTITWAISWQIYNKSSNELKAEAQELARLQNITIRALQYVEGVELNMSSDGKKVLGIKVKESSSDTVKVVARGDPD